MKFERKKQSFSEAVVGNCSMRKIALKILPKFTCNLIVKETPTLVFSVNLEHLKNTCKWLVLDFEQFYMSHSIIHFTKRNSKKGNFYLLNVFNRISALGELSPKEITRFENATFR